MKCLFIFLLYPLCLSAQSEFISDTRFGIKADMVYSINNDFLGIGGDVGISLHGLIDIGFEYIKTYYALNNKIESYGKTVYAAYNFRSENNSLKVLLGYSHNTISSSKNLFNSSLNFAGPLLSIIISPKIFENESILIIPGFGFSMAFLSDSDKSGFNNKPGKDHIISAELEFNFISKMSRKFYLIIAPSVSKELSNMDNPLIAGFNVGFLFNIPNQ